MAHQWILEIFECLTGVDLPVPEICKIGGWVKEPFAIQLCRSGECMCGTMQSQQMRAEAKACYPEWGAWIDDLERVVKRKHGFGWGETMPAPADPRQADFFQPMCAGCAGDGMTVADRLSLGAAA